MVDNSCCFERKGGILISTKKIYKISFVSCVAWFLSLCFLHYFSLRPLWCDEQCVFENIENYSFLQIFSQLRQYQVFPRVYLFIIKFLSQIFNYHLLSLRFFSLTSMLSAFFIWAKVYKKAFSCKWHYLLALFSFGGSYYLSYYAAELKQYSMDVLVMGIFCLYLFYQKQLFNKAPSKLFFVATLLLPVSFCFSYASFFVFWIVIYNYIFIVRRNFKILPLLVSYSTGCLLVIPFVFYFDIRHTLSLTSLFSLWDNYFLPTDSFYAFQKSFTESVKRLTVVWFGKDVFFRKTAAALIPIFVVSLFGYGIKALKNSKFRWISIDAAALIVFLEMIILGILKKYPFDGDRFTLFFAPFVFYLIVKGISALQTKRFLYIILNVFYVVFLIACSIASFFLYLKFYI